MFVSSEPREMHKWNDTIHNINWNETWWVVTIPLCFSKILG